MKHILFILLMAFSVMPSFSESNSLESQIFINLHYDETYDTFGDYHKVPSAPISICLENQYGTASKFIQDEPYLNSHIIKNCNSDNATTERINDADNVIKDSDVVVFNIPGGLNDTDSVVWYLTIGNDFENEKKKVVSLENISERSYKFIASATNIDCEFGKKYGKEYTVCRFGESWGGGFNTFDGTCRFICDVYDNGKLRNRYYSKSYVLDVLPVFPTIDVIKIWYSEELTCSIASIKVHHENAEITCLQVLPYYDSRIEYHEADFSKESDGLYDVELNIWGEDILYCISWNDYGFCKGPWINVYTADIKDVEDSKLIVAIDCNKVKIHKDGECKIEICSLDGKICASSKFTNEYTTLLNKGVYIIRVRDIKSNRINVKSIIVK